MWIYTNKCAQPWTSHNIRERIASTRTAQVGRLLGWFRKMIAQATISQSDIQFNEIADRDQQPRRISEFVGDVDQSQPLQSSTCPTSIDNANRKKLTMKTMCFTCWTTMISPNQIQPVKHFLTAQTNSHFAKILNCYTSEDEEGNADQESHGHDCLCSRQKTVDQAPNDLEVTQHPGVPRCPRNGWWENPTGKPYTIGCWLIGWFIVAGLQSIF